MRKILYGIALTVPALLMSACSGGNSASNSTLPGQTGMAHSSLAVKPPDTGSGNDLHAGGATFPAQAYNGASQPVGLASDPNQPKAAAGSLFASYGGTGNIYYCLTGSGYGRGVFDGANASQTTAACAALGASPTGFGAAVDPPDFVGSDTGLKQSEYALYQTNREPSGGTNYGEPFEFPAIAGPIVFGYKSTDFPGIVAPAKLKLSRWSYCAIANGTVGDWNDPAITRDNGGTSITGGTSLPITFYFRSDSSGTTFNFTSHLNAVCLATWHTPYNTAPYQGLGRSAQWLGGVSSNWTGPTTGRFIGASGNPGVLAGIQSATVGATGYVEGGYAAVASHPSVAQAMLRNQSGQFIDPTIKADVKATFAKVTTASILYGGAGDGNGAMLATTRPDCIMFIDPSNFSNPTTSTAYPIGAISFMLFYGNNQGVHTADKLKLINYMQSKAANVLINKQEYANIPAGIQAITSAAANGTGNYSGKPCFQ